MILGDSVEVPENNCLCCGYLIDRASVCDSPITRPRSNDVTICVNCGEIMIFDHELKLRKPNDNDLRSIATDTNLMFNIVMAKTAIHQIKKSS